jgi:small subunit ribosomal protein S18
MLRVQKASGSRAALKKPTKKSTKLHIKRQLSSRSKIQPETDSEPDGHLYTPNAYFLTPSGLPGDRQRDSMNTRDPADLDPTYYQHARARRKNPLRFDVHEDEELYDRLLAAEAGDNKVQVEAFREKRKAERMKKKLQAKAKELRLPIDHEDVVVSESEGPNNGTETDWAEMNAPTFNDFTKARHTLHYLQQNDTVDFSGKDDRFHGILDPFNPPNLTYEHVKLLKNIDYSPLVKRAAQGGQFTVEDVITILQDEGVTDMFKSAIRREHAQDPVVFSRTYDVFNKGRKPCPLCLPDPTVDQVNRIHYTNVNLLRKYLSTSGMIIPRSVSGVCVTHQRKLRYAIKNAKQLALLSYTSNWHVPFSYVDPSKFNSYDDQHAAADVERERRLEIKAIFDNLITDKQALLSGKSLDEAGNPIGAAAASQEAAQSQLTPSQEVQFAAASKIRDSKAKMDAALLKTTDPVEIAELHKIHEEEVANINYDMNKELQSAEDNSQDSLRADFGELLDLDTFDINMSFDEFIHKYNARMASLKIKPMDHAEILLQDSEHEQETPQQKFRRQRQLDM